MSRSGTYRDHTAIIRVGVGPWPLESPRRPGISMPGPSTKSLTTLVPRLVRARSPACESDNRPGRIACYYYQITIPSNWYAAGRLVVRRHRCAAADREVEMARGRHRHIHGPGPALQRAHRHRRWRKRLTSKVLLFILRPLGIISWRPCPRVRPRRHATQRVRRSEIFKLSLAL